MSVAKHLMMAGSGGIGFTYVYSADATNVVLYDDLIAAGWNEVYDVTVFINSGVTISGDPAMTISGFPSGAGAPSITIVNNGRISGDGGQGGIGAIDTTPDSGSERNATNGQKGKDALHVSSSISLNNLAGQIYAGGGGGGGGGAFSNSIVTYSQGGNGGVGAGGTRDTGAAGTVGIGYAGDGGAGGAFATAGFNGEVNGVAPGRPPGSGGAAGSAIIGASYVTFVNRGSILGAETG